MVSLEVARLRVAWSLKSLISRLVRACLLKVGSPLNLTTVADIPSAISRRVPTDGQRGGHHAAPRGGFGGGNRGGHDNGSKFRKHDNRPAHDPRHTSPRAEQGIALPPSVPGFGFQLPGFNM